MMRRRRSRKKSQAFAPIAAAAVLAACVAVPAAAPSPAEADAASPTIRAGSSVGGDSTDGELQTCSVTVPGRRLSDGNVQLLTSGWCADRSVAGSDRFSLVDRPTAGAAAVVVASDLGSKAVGPSLWEPDGVGLVDVTAPNGSTLPEALTWGMGAGSQLASAPVKVRDVVAPKVGDQICKSSDMTGWTCGKVLGITDGYAGEGKVPYEQIVTDLCSTRGETGAPGMVGTSLVGMLIGSSFSETCDPTAQDTSQPYSSFVSLKSAVGRPAVLATLAGHWEPQVAVEPPVVANAAGTAVAATTSVRGILPFGGSNHTVSLTLPSREPITAPVRSDGTWEISLSGVIPGRYSYSLTAKWGSLNTSTPVSGTLTVVETTRIAGADRWTGSVLASKAGFPGSAPIVYVASGETFPDALSASAAAAMEGGPLLLTPGGSLLDVTRAEIQRLKPSRIIVVGGEAAVGAAVSAQLASLAPVTRVAGADRFETSRAVAARFPATSVAYLATGLDFPDALSASAAGGSRKAPVILVDGRLSTVDQPTLDRLRALKTASVKLLGGTTAISAGIETQVAASFTVARLAGPVREDTSRLVNDDYFQSATSAYLATSGAFPDALSGGALAAHNRSPLYLVPGGCVPAATLQSIAARGATTVVTLGGTAVVSEAATNLATC